MKIILFAVVVVFVIVLIGFLVKLPDNSQRAPSQVISDGEGTTLGEAFKAVHGELIVKLLREAGIALGSESANGSNSMRFAGWDYLQHHQSAYHCEVSYGCDVGCNRLGSLRVFTPSQPHSKIVYGQEILDEQFR